MRRSEVTVGKSAGVGVKLGLTARDQRVLAYAWRFRLLSRDQIMALAPFGSVTRANTRLASLVRAGILMRRHLPIVPGDGSAQALYGPGLESIQFLAADPQAVRRHVRQVSRWETAQVTHVIAANQVLVDAISALGNGAEGNLLSFRTEPELRETFLNRALVPDGWFSWRVGVQRFNCFVEVDLHTEGLTQWRDKVLDYVDYAMSQAPLPADDIYTDAVIRNLDMKPVP